jgi:hypothetical protein
MMPMRRYAVAWSLKAAWWCVLAPFVITKKLARGITRGVGAWALATRDAIPCPGCGDDVSLVGRFECSWCGFVFDGFAFARCEVCGAVPPFMECRTCGHGVRNPMIFG